MIGIEDGGPAFPRPASHDGTTAETGHAGMSLRDWFASQVLSGIIGNTTVTTGIDHVATASNRKSQDVIAELAYEIADAMVKARR